MRSTRVCCLEDSQPPNPCPASKPSVRLSIDQSRFGEFMRRCGTATLCICLALLAVGCPKHGTTEYSQGRKAEEISDYDAALTFYQQALKADPNNANLKIKVDQIRFEASNYHIKLGLE